MSLLLLPFLRRGAAVAVIHDGVPAQTAHLAFECDRVDGHRAVKVPGGRSTPSVPTCSCIDSSGAHRVVPSSAGKRDAMHRASQTPHRYHAWIRSARRSSELVLFGSASASSRTRTHIVYRFWPRALDRMSAAFFRRARNVFELTIFWSLFVYLHERAFGQDLAQTRNLQEEDWQVFERVTSDVEFSEIGERP